MDLQRLKTFRTVATLMNFSQAAQVLNYAQSSISAQIKTLETELGSELFARSGKKIALTEAGEKMLRYAHKLLAIEEEARAELSGEKYQAGLISLRMPQTVSTYLLPRVLQMYQQRFPEVHLDVSSCAMYSLEHELAIGTVDLAFLLANSIDVAALKFEMLGIMPLILVASPGHALAQRTEIGYPDLRGQTIFLPKADCGYRMEFEQTLAAMRITPRALIEMNSIEAIKKTVMLGVGLTVLPEIAVQQELQENQLARLAWNERWETGLCMIWHKDKWFSRALSTLVEMFRLSMHDNFIVSEVVEA